MNTVSADRLRSLLHYDPETGLFTRNVSRQGFHADTEAGTFHKQSGYILVGVDRKHYRAHRLAWLYMMGEWPSEVDHINGDRADNRWRTYAKRPARRTMQTRNAAQTIRPGTRA